MLSRFGIGLIKGALLGAIVTSALLFGVGWASLPVWLAYVLAAVSGALVGLIAGKPIWQKDAKIEAGLKAVAGLLLGLLAMLALRKWVNLPPDLLPKGQSAVGQVSVASLPIITTVLSMLFELDNTPAPEGEEGASGGDGAEVKQGKSRVALPAELDDIDDQADAQQQKRQGKR